jgi:ankyrin repeat protein
VHEETGMNVLVMYILKKNKPIINQLLMRGTNINFVFPVTGFTPIHWAIKNNVSSKIVSFLIKQGAYVHAVDNNGLDCCDKSVHSKRYYEVSELVNQYCKYNSSLRKNSKQMYQYLLKQKELQMRENIFGQNQIFFKDKKERD